MLVFAVIAGVTGIAAKELWDTNVVAAVALAVVAVLAASMITVILTGALKTSGKDG
jgi:hypothetical protein